MKNLFLLIILISIVLIIVGISNIVSAKFPDLLVPAKSEIVLRKVNIVNTEIRRGENINLSFSLYNNTENSKKVTAGFFLLKEGKVYDGVNLDYVSRKQMQTIESKKSINLSWNIPVYTENGNYKVLVWIHEIKDGAEFVVKDYWYPQLIKIKEPEQKIMAIYGESNINPGIDYYISALSISPQEVPTDQPISIKYEIIANSDEDVELNTGVFLINKDKIYNGENIDFQFINQKKNISAKEKVEVNYYEKIDLPKGKYRVLIWLHKVLKDKEELIEDYFAPGEIEITEPKEKNNINNINSI